MPEVLTAAEVAGWLKLSADYVRELAAAGHLPCIRFGREYRFQRSLIETWLTESAYKRASISTAVPTRRRGGRTYVPPESALDEALARRTTPKILSDDYVTQAEAQASESCPFILSPP